MQSIVTNKTELAHLLQKNKSKLISFGVQSIGIFGSFSKNKQNTNSDIDILVEFIPGKKNYKNFIHLAYYLEDLLGRKVELLTPQALSPYMKDHILNEVEYVPLAA